jgi:MFS family permease
MKTESMNAVALAPGDVRMILYGVLLAIFLGSLELTIVAPALTLIAHDLKDVHDMPWIATSYLVTATAVTPLYGKASDIYGRRIMMLIAIAVFVAGAIACASAPTMIALVIARGVQGIGGGGLISLPQIIMADIIAPKERGRYQAWVAGTFTASALIGPVLGGFLSQHVHWSAIFWINVPLGMIALLLTNHALKGLPRHDHPHTLDLIGAFLMTGATASMMLSLNGAQRPEFAWQVGFGSLMLWILFAYRLRLAREPLVPLRVLFNPIIRSATISSALAYGTNIALTIYVPVYLQRVMHLSATSAGVALVPMVIATVIGTTISGQVTARVDRYKGLPLAGLLLATLALMLVAVLGTRLTLVSFTVLLSTSSMSLGMLFPVAIVMMQNAADRRDVGVATASMSFFRQLSAAMLVALYGAMVVGRRGDNDGIGAFTVMFASAAATLAASLFVFGSAAEIPLRVVVSTKR